MSTRATIRPELTVYANHSSHSTVPMWGRSVVKAYDPTAGFAGDSAASRVLLPAFGMPTATRRGKFGSSTLKSERIVIVILVHFQVNRVFGHNCHMFERADAWPYGCAC